LNKKQEALRRGLRSFIEDTSKELADLEGRPLRSPENPTDTDEVDASAALVGAEPERAAPAAPPRTPDISAQAADPGRTADAAARTPDLRARASDLVARPSAAAPAVSVPQPPKASPRPVSAAPEPRPSLTEPPLTESPEASSGAAPTPAVPREASPPQAEKPKRRSHAPVRRRPRPAAEIGADGVSPAQAHARKGVCFAYFLNHECWRVADAYCNSALQVCITRECPIYHLHKDALERRFARKFKHFW
jgi:hypothetical protein